MGDERLEMVTGNFTDHNLVKVNKLVTDIDVSHLKAHKGPVGPRGATTTPPASSGKPESRRTAGERLKSGPSIYGRPMRSMRAPAAARMRRFPAERPTES